MWELDDIKRNDKPLFVRALKLEQKSSRNSHAEESKLSVVNTQLIYSLISPNTQALNLGEVKFLFTSRYLLYCRCRKNNSNSTSAVGGALK